MIRQLVYILSVLNCSLFCVLGANAQIELISSTPQSAWNTSILQKSSTRVESEAIIELYPKIIQQKIEGFGGCFNELGWDALQLLSEQKQDEVMNLLFDSHTGCSFTFCRMPIGANDYANDWYSFNETKNDFEMKNFSIERDKKRLIPYIKSALRIQPALRLWASPWSPPSWLKSNENYACYATKLNGLGKNKSGKEMETQFIMDKPHLDAYALYISKFIRAYQEEKIRIEAVHVQNEMNSCQSFPSCIWRPEDIAVFIGRYLGPKLYSEAQPVDIWLGTIERPQMERIDTVLANTLAKKYIKGAGFQWAGKDAIATVHKKYPNLNLMQTETECGDGSNDWKAAEHTFNLMEHYFKAGAGAYMYWNMILLKNGLSYWGWKQNAMISVDSMGDYHCNPEFYLMKHFSNLVEPGAYKIQITPDLTNILAFKNPDRSIIIICANLSEQPKEFVFKNGENYIQFTGLAHSFNSLKLQ